MGWRVSLVIILPVSRETICSIGSYGARDVLWNPEPDLLPSLYHFILQLDFEWEECVSFETLSDFDCPFLSVSVQPLSCVRLCDPMDCSTRLPLSITNSQSLLKLMSIKSVMPSNHLILCHPLLLLLQSFPASGSFPVNQFFASDGQSIGASTSASVLPMNIQD